MPKLWAKQSLKKPPQAAGVGELGAALLAHVVLGPEVDGPDVRVQAGGPAGLVAAPPTAVRLRAAAAAAATVAAHFFAEANRRR